MNADQSAVYKEIDRRLKAYSIDLKDYIYVDPKIGSTLKVNNTTLDGITFLEKSKFALSANGKSLEYALSNAKSSNGCSAFAGQIKKSDLDNAMLQMSFLATKGKGFREIFYLPDEANPAVALGDPEKRILLNQDNQFFDLKFGKMTDAPDITSIHVDMEKTQTSIHLDKQGFIFASGKSGEVYLSSNVLQHIIDELIIKDKFFGLFGDSYAATLFKKHVTTISQVNRNSISDPASGKYHMENNRFLRGTQVRAVLGLEASYDINRLQIFTRGTLGLKVNEEKKPEVFDGSITVGLRGTF